MSEEQETYNVPAPPPHDLRPPISFEAVQAVFDEPLFTVAGTAELLLSVGRPVHGNGYSTERAQEELWEICKAFAFERYHEVLPGLSDQDMTVQKLVHACAIVLREAGFDPSREPSPRDLLPFLGAHGLFAQSATHARNAGEEWADIDGTEATMAQFRAVYQLRQSALTLRDIMARRRAMKGVARPGRKPEQAIKRLAEGLSTFYWLTWLERPSVALDVFGEEATSPFLRLFVGVHRALAERGLDPTPKPRTADSLRKVWERLDDSERLNFKST